MKKKGHNNLLFPLSIIIVGVIIAVGIFIVRTQPQEKPLVDQETKQELKVRPLSSEDKILGNPNAEVIIVEYSDFECPYCQKFFSDMLQIMDEYGRDGKVAWVIRHFPLEKIHPRAKPSAVASECVYNLGGNELFWIYSREIFENAPASLTKEGLEKYATDLGINANQFNTCLSNNEVLAKVERDIQDGMLIYENDPNFGTPYSFIVTKTGIQTKIIGSPNYSEIRKLIENFI